MEKFLQFLDKVIAIENDLLEIKPRLSNTVGSATKVLNAALAADLGNTERAVITRLATVSAKLETLVT